MSHVPLKVMKKRKKERKKKRKKDVEGNNIINKSVEIGIRMRRNETQKDHCERS